MTFLAAKLQGSLSELSQIIAAKTIKKIHIAHRQWRSNSPRGGKTNIQKRKTESYIFSGFGNDISCGWEQKMTTGRFPTG